MKLKWFRGYIRVGANLRIRVRVRANVRIRARVRANVRIRVRVGACYNPNSYPSRNYKKLLQPTDDLILSLSNIYNNHLIFNLKTSQCIHNKVY